jgi:hypothetical protein
VAWRRRTMEACPNPSQIGDDGRGKVHGGLDELALRGVLSVP